MAVLLCLPACLSVAVVAASSLPQRTPVPGLPPFPAQSRSRPNLVPGPILFPAWNYRAYAALCADLFVSICQAAGRKAPLILQDIASMVSFWVLRLSPVSSLAAKLRT